MRRLSIFLYFLVLMTMSLRLGDIFAIMFVGSTFLYFYQLAEQFDEEDDNDLVDRIN
jgi:hypothetical protein